MILLLMTMLLLFVDNIGFDTDIATADNVATIC